MQKQRLRVSFSGGRTSAYMSIWLKTYAEADYEMVFTFANTGWEHPDTLRFVNEIDKRFGLNLVWLEAVPRRAEGKATGHKIVTYETAARNGGPFEAVTQAYGLPTPAAPICTRELKRNTMRSYTHETLGWEPNTYITAIGIRADEARRVNKATAAKEQLAYPLIDTIPTTKEDVLAFFEGQPWDLQIEEYQGNCVGCFKKSERKLLHVYREDKSSFEFPIKLERLYSKLDPTPDQRFKGTLFERKMYRSNRSASELVAHFETIPLDYAPTVHDGGCSESCEIYDTAPP